MTGDLEAVAYDNLPDVSLMPPPPRGHRTNLDVADMMRRGSELGAVTMVRGADQRLMRALQSAAVKTSLEVWDDIVKLIQAAVEVRLNWAIQQIDHLHKYQMPQFEGGIRGALGIQRQPRLGDVTPDFVSLDGVLTILRDAQKDPSQ